MKSYLNKFSALYCKICSLFRLVLNYFLLLDLFFCSQQPEFSNCHHLKPFLIHQFDFSHYYEFIFYTFAIFVMYFYL